MVAFCDEVAAFWDGRSKGTEFTIKYAAELGAPVQIHLVEER